MGREPTGMPRPEGSPAPRQASFASTSSNGASATRITIADSAYVKAEPAALQRRASQTAVIPRGAGYDTTLSRPEGFFITPDTAPAGLSVTRSRWVAPALLLVFGVSAAAVDKLLAGSLTHAYGYLLTGLADVPAGIFGKQISAAIRPLFLLLALVFALTVSGTLRRRLLLLTITVGVFCLLTLITDLALTRAALIGGPGPFGVLGNTVAGINGIVALAAGIFSTAVLPPGVVVRSELRRPRSNLVLLVIVGAAAVAAVWAMKVYWSGIIALIGRVPLLGGVASVVVIFFTVFPVMLYLVDLIKRRRRVLDPAALPSVGVVVPARNEEGLIGDCIRAIDDAAAGYPAPCSVYIVENGSSDRTYAEAMEALAGTRHVRGVVLQCEPKGKAHALNSGIRHATEDIVLRIDADTLITTSVLSGLLSHFDDPAVGGVSGMPLPRVQSSWICRMRALEVYYQVGFKRSGYNAIDAIGVLPGALVAYRRYLVVKLNGFAEGVNGEDADMAVRVGRLGYKIVSDPTIRAYTEMPSTFGYLREQRMRWARGTYHMLARNKSGIWMMQGLRCIWMLPWAGFIMFRRLMIVPFAAAAFILLLLSRVKAPPQEVAAGGAILLGVQLVQMAVCMIFVGDRRLIASIPSYLLFRLIVSFFALETLLSLAFDRRASQ
jgi:cellulose synthase/poly-beta-1,6-N-acetylglucosamine synthase-like glycosyltransferase